MGCISLGLCNKTFLCLYLSSFGIMIGLIILSNIGRFWFRDKSYYNLYFLNFKDSNILYKVLLSYLGQSFFIIFQIILKFSLKNERKNNKEKKMEKASVIKLIFNHYSDRLTNKDLINIILFSFLLLFIDISKEILRRNYFLIAFGNYSIYQLFFLFILSKKFYQIKFYMHQYFSIIVILILQVILFIFLFNLISYNIKFLYIFIYLPLQIFVAFLESFFIIYIKGLME